MAKVTSSLSSAANKIVNINRSTSVMRNTQSSYSEFLRFMDIETKNLQAIKFDQKKLKKAYSANVTATFGSAGNLLSGLANGALDVGSLLGGMFGGKDKPSAKAGKPIPKGQKIRIPGVRGIGILAPLLAGLDFAQGIAGGESVGKAASGAAGSAVGAAAGGAAGVALAGLIGQTLVPVPGLGFVLGAAVGGLGAFAGGYLGDRAYEGVTGEGRAKEKTRAKLKQQEQKQRIQAASLTQLTFPQVLDKFDSVVFQFERTVANLDLGGETTETPYGYDEELGEDEAPKLPDGTTDEGTDSIKYGTGNAEFGETGNVSNQDGWVHGHFQSDSAAAVTRDTTMVVKALLKQGSPVYLNPGVDLKPNKEYSDAEITKHVENARKAHTHSGAGKSIDVFVKKGTKVPVPLTNIGPTGKGFGGYGKGGIAGYIQGTRTWIGHLKPGSKGGLSQSKGEIKAKGKESGEMEGLYPGSQDKPQAKVTSQTKPIPTSAVKPTQDLSKMSTDQLKGMLDPTVTGAANPAVFKAAQEARTKGEESGLSGESLEREVLIASIRAKNAEAQVMALSQQSVVPQQLQQYPSYIMGQNTTTLIPIIQGSGGNQPMVISSGGGSGGGGQTVVMSGPSEGQVLNSLMKTILLTSLSAT